jgi:digeranylgeranylglycerophospholipid reductase
MNSGEGVKADILVVGAGPAGSTAAEAAARLGAEVLLVDRKSEIGTPVQCGGFLPEAHELRELMPSARLPEALVDIPGRCILHRTKVQRIFSPSGRSKEFSVDGRVLDRRSFDRHLAHRAAWAGANILPATRASVSQGEVRLSGHCTASLMPTVIIGADGPNSAVARSIGALDRSELGICVEYEMVDVDIDPGAAEMYFGSRIAPGGYAWIIPLGSDSANVGIGVRTSYLEKGARLPEILDGFIRDHPLAREKLFGGEVVSIMRGSVPAGGMVSNVCSGNVLLAGDAAGHVMATSGGGIPLASVAGNIAGEVAAGHLNGSAKLSEYLPKIKSAFGLELERSVQIRRLVDLAMKSDRMIDAIFGVLEPDQMKAVMRGQIPGALKAFFSTLSGSAQA